MIPCQDSVSLPCVVQVQQQRSLPDFEDAPSRLGDDITATGSSCYTPARAVDRDQTKTVHRKQGRQKVSSEVKRNTSETGLNKSVKPIDVHQARSDTTRGSSRAPVSCTESRDQQCRENRVKRCRSASEVQLAATKTTSSTDEQSRPMNNKLDVPSSGSNIPRVISRSNSQGHLATRLKELESKIEQLRSWIINSGMQLKPVKSEGHITSTTSCHRKLRSFSSCHVLTPPTSPRRRHIQPVKSNDKISATWKDSLPTANQRIPPSRRVMEPESLVFAVDLERTRKRDAEADDAGTCRSHISHQPRFRAASVVYARFLPKNPEKSKQEPTAKQESTTPQIQVFLLILFCIY